MRAIVAASVVLLSGCTGDDGAVPAGNDIADLPAATVLEKSLAAWKAVPSFRMEIHSDPPDARSSTTLSVVGTDVRGELVRDGASSDVLKVGANCYMRPDEAFWATMLDKPRQARAYAAFADRRWIKVERGTDLIVRAGLDGAFLFAERTALTPAVPRQVSLGERADVGGVPTITVLDSRNDGPSGTRVSVATTGEPYPIRWNFGTAVADFTDFGTTTDTIEDPAPADVVELADVVRGA